MSHDMFTHNESLWENNNMRGWRSAMPKSTWSRVTEQGTAMAEATLCEDHYVEPFISYANAVADDADDVGLDRSWYDSSGNDSVHCVECGA